MPLERMRLQSEPYGSTGNIGENFRKLLGAPGLDPLQTVVREAVQNIADAAKLGRGPEIVFRLRQLTRDQASVLRECMLTELPVEPGSMKQLEALKSRDRPVVLEICDFGTSGLGGPTRADRIPIGTTTTDFIDFIRNIGTVRDTAHGGGTYGFGKVSLYRVSLCSTILLDSMVAGGGAGARRVMGCHIGSSFDLTEDSMLRRYTGRHWWGALSPDNGDFVDPLVDEDAEELAEALGFPSRDSERSGTSIMILDFDLVDEDLEETAQRIVETILWNFWPRMMRDVGSDRRFHCRVEADGKDIPVPSPEHFPPLDLFCKAMTAARSGNGQNLLTIRAERLRKELGTLAIERGLRGRRHHIVDRDSLFPDTSRHIALMRPVELVVKYLEGTALPDDRLEWAGVFLVNEEDGVERSFAESEPPAHDDWIADNLPKGPTRTYVNVALRELRVHALAVGMAGPGQPITGISGPPLARVAGRLGSILEGTSGEGAGRGRVGRDGGGGNRARPARARASRPIFLRLEQDEAGALAIFTTEVRQDLQHKGGILKADAAVALDGGAANNVDGLSDPPKIIGIRGGEPTISGAGERLDIGTSEGTFEILVRMPHDCAVTVDVEVNGVDNP